MAKEEISAVLQKNGGGQTSEDVDDDYMSMAIPEPPKAKIESSFQRRAREKREAEERSRPKSKAEREEEARAKHEADLATSIDESNKGFKMMQKLGFKGGALGKGGPDSDARTEPIIVEVREDRGGIGRENEKKQKFREHAERAEGVEKKVKADEGDYRERVRKEREEKKLESQMIGAMKVAERLDEEAENDQTVGDPGSESAKTKASKPLKSVNVLWRGNVRHRLEKERSRRMRYDLNQSLTRLPTYDDPEEDQLDRQAFGREEEELDEDDPELAAFIALEPGEKVAKLVAHLRTVHNYCFWCKFQYPDETLEGCPGMTEEDHD